MMKLLLTLALAIALVVDARAYADVPKVEPGSKDNTKTYNDPNGIGIIKSALNAGIMESFMVLGGATKIYYCDGHVWAQFYGSPVWVNVTKDLRWHAWEPGLKEKRAIYYPSNDNFLNADGISKANGLTQNWQFVGYGNWAESLVAPVGSNVLVASADPALDDKWEFFSNNTWQVLSNQVAKTLQPYATQSWLSRPQDVAVQLFIGPASESKWQLRGYCILGDASPQLLQKLNGVFQKLAANASFLEHAPLTPKQFLGDQLVLPGPGTQPPPGSEPPGDQKPPSDDKDKGRDKKTPPSESPDKSRDKKAPPSESPDKSRDKKAPPPESPDKSRDKKAPPPESPDKGRDKKTQPPTDDSNKGREKKAPPSADSTDKGYEKKPLPPPADSTDKGREKTAQPETGNTDKHLSDPSQHWRQEKEQPAGSQWRDKEKSGSTDSQ